MGTLYIYIVWRVCGARSETPRFYRPKARIANPESGESGQPISRAEAALNGPVTHGPTRVLYATVPSSSGPARKHTAKFEPAERVKRHNLKEFAPELGEYSGRFAERSGAARFSIYLFI